MLKRLVVLTVVLSVVLVQLCADAVAQEALTLLKRFPWTTSRVAGSPEPPLPFRAQRVFANVAFKNPTCLTSAPGTSRLFVAEQGGQLFSIPDDPACRQADPFLDVKELVERLNLRLEPDDRVNSGAVYGLTFHPGFATNRQCFVCYVVSYQKGGRGQHPHGTRVVRLTVDDNDPPRAIPGSEVEVITWLQGGHNGGCLKFGLDGKLFVSTGDGGNAFPPDGLNSGQDVSNLLSAVLRIDVDRPERAADGSIARAYSIPDDNPLVSIDGARGEIWAYGMRNPWKMSIDRQTGELWIGDVGWELWELVYRVKPGDNFGWSLFEGRQPVHAERRRGPTPIVPPAVEIPHTDGASITGGFVYRGEKFPELRGKYIFGDWETRRIWGVDVAPSPATESGVGPREELVDPMVRIVGFAERNDGELLLLDYDAGTIHELAHNRADEHAGVFPRRLSESGLFSDVAHHELAPGVIGFDVNVEGWSDFATSDRFLGLPGDAAIGLHSKAESIPGSMFNRTLDFPKNSVLAKTLELELVAGDPSSRKRIETQILHFNGYDWRGYSYRWNEQQTDAELVAAQGASIEIRVNDAQAPDGVRLQQWRIPSRMECIRCHNPWAEFALAFNVPQLNRLADFEVAASDETASGRSRVLNQIDGLRQIGVLRDVLPEPIPKAPPEAQDQPLTSDELPRLTDPLDVTADLTARARSYIHTNCAHCHRFNGGGAAHIHMPFDTPLLKTETVGTRPTLGTFGIHDAEILAPGDPFRSVLYFRMAKSGSGHMPRLGTSLLDQRGLDLIHDWIDQLPVQFELQAKLESLSQLDETAILAREQAETERTRWRLIRAIAERNGRNSPENDDIAEGTEQARREASGRIASRQRQRETLVSELVASPGGGLMLARSLQGGEQPASVRQVALALAAKQSDPAIRDLFEQLLPEEQRTKRLGDAIRPDELLALSGSADRGRELFLSSNQVQCRNCHKASGQGKEVGPDLSEVGKKLDRAKLLESILEPSRTIDPKYQTWLIETVSGKVLSGLLISRNEQLVVLRDAENREHQLTTEEIDGMFPQQKSLMPDLLLRDLTAQQVADLLAWLATLKPVPAGK